jgi:hypothetical protein
MTIKTTSKFIIVLVLSLSYFLTFTECESVDKRTDVDYLIFRQIWPEPTCMFPGVNFLNLFSFSKKCSIIYVSFERLIHVKFLKMLPLG